VLVHLPSKENLLSNILILVIAAAAPPALARGLQDTTASLHRRQQALIGGDYCIWGPDETCYEAGWPACCAAMTTQRVLQIDLHERLRCSSRQAAAVAPGDPMRYAMNPADQHAAAKMPIPALTIRPRAKSMIRIICPRNALQYPAHDYFSPC